MASLKLKSGRRARVLQGHPWVYASEVQRLLSKAYNGEVVECRDAKGRLIGSGIYNARSQIVWRRLSYENVPLEESFFRERIRKAIAWRGHQENVRRLIWSESDGLPGVVVDQYEDIVVVQFLTLAMEKRKHLFIQILADEVKPSCMILRNDAPVRKHEGLDSYVEVVLGKIPEAKWIKIGEIEYWLDFEEGHKTGFYLDQRFQHQRVGSLAHGRKVLDAFCNQGGFALTCANNGASQVTAVDISAESITAVKRNAEHQNFDLNLVQGNVFDFFQEKRGEQWDLIVLDPPSFTKSKDRLDDALRGYKELNLRALQGLTIGGILATYSCSFHVDLKLFQEVLVDAAMDAKRAIKLIEYAHQPSDHPILIGMPESEYLKGLIVQVVDR